MFNEPAVNTFSEELCAARKKVSGLKFLGSLRVGVEPLATILDNASAPTEIDFMDIDVEGYDMEVLKSNNWDHYRPKVLLVEQQFGPNTVLEDLEIVRFLKGKDYTMIAMTFSTFFFGRNDFINSALL
jgi:hypothetical protein